MRRTRDTRTYITLHDGILEHPKIEGLSDKAFRTLIECWCWCSKNTSDGRIPAASWAKRGTAAARKALLAAGLAVTVEEGVDMHDYLAHQRSAAEIEETKLRRQMAGSLGGKKKAENLASANPNSQRTSTEEVASVLASASPVAKQTANKNVAVSVSVTEELPKDTEADASAAALEESESIGQRSNRLTKTYTDKVKLSNFPAVSGVVRKAINAGFDDRSIVDALLRLADEGRPVTTDVLRIELEGKTPPKRRTNDDKVLDGANLAVRMAQKSNHPDHLAIGAPQ
jgi:hypothetical protein